MTGRWETEVRRSLPPVGAAHDPAFLRGRPTKRLTRWQRKGLRRAAIALFVLLAGGAAALPVLRRSQADGTDPRFELKEIRIEGASRTRRLDLEEVLQPLIGRNLIGFDLAEARHRVESLPWIEGLSIAKQLPGTLLVEVRERGAVAFVVRQGRLSWIASDGRLLGPYDRGRGETDLPVIVGDPSPEEVVRIAGLLGRVARTRPDFLPRIGEIRVGENSEILFHDPVADCDVTIDPVLFEESYAGWLSIRAEVSRRFGQLDGVDLRFRDQLVLRPSQRSNA